MIAALRALRSPVSRPGTKPRPGRLLPITLLAALVAAPSAGAQLRPLEPLPWRIFDGATTITAQAGFGRHQDQRASLAGTTGTLSELGNIAVAWRSGRIAVEMGGTVRRQFRDRSSYGDPHAAVSQPGPRRSDSGDYNIGTLVSLTPPDRPAMLALRFGTRLPNSDDAEGLDRDRTDFYAMLGGRLRHQRLLVGAEAGLGIFGTHDTDFEQSDPLVYSVVSEYSLTPVTLVGAFVGHRAGFGGWVQRGNETLSELRLGAGVGTRHRLQLLYVNGLSLYSPSSGWLLTVSTSR